MSIRTDVKRLFSSVAVLLAVSLPVQGVAASTGEDVIVVVPEDGIKPSRLSKDVARWRTELGRQDVLWVDSVKREKPSGFKSMAVLNFSGGAQRDAWMRANEAVLPAGLRVIEADVLAEGGAAPAKGGKPVYKISYYQLTAPRQQFQAWVDGYLVKYLEAQIQHRILSRYAMYLEAGPSGRALLVLEYVDAATEQGAEPIKEKLSEDIVRVDEEYARQSMLKESLRVTQSWTLAVPAK